MLLPASIVIIFKQNNKDTYSWILQSSEPISFFKVIETIWPSRIFLQGKSRLVEYDLFRRKGRKESGLLWLFCFCSVSFAIFHFGQYKLQRVKANINRRKRTIKKTLTSFYSVAAYNCKGLKWIYEVNTLARSIFNTYYNLFKILSPFWLAKSTRLIHHNQLLMTKFGRNLTLTRKWRQKCSVFAG